MIEFTSEIIEKNLRGDDVLGVVAVEADYNSEKADVAFHDKHIEKIPFTKFLYIKNFDNVGEEANHQLYKLQDQYNYHLQFKKEYDTNKFQFAVRKSMIMILRKINNFLDKYNIYDYQKLEKKVEEHFEKNVDNSILVQAKKNIIEYLNDKNDYISISRDIDNYIETLQEEKETFEEKVDEYESELNELNDKLKKARFIINNYVDNLPSMLEIQMAIAKFNAKVKDEKNLLHIEELYQYKNEHGDPYDRIKNGYTHIISCKGSFQVITFFFEKFLNIPLYSDMARDMNLFIVLPVNEQFLIDRKIRFFKGIINFNEIHTLYVDIETTSLYPLVKKCKKCNKVHNISSTFEDVHKCNNIVHVDQQTGYKVYCNSVEFETVDIGQIYIISAIDNRGFEKVWVADFEKAKDFDENDEYPKYDVNNDSERKIIVELYNTIQKLNPAIINGYNSEVFDWNFILYRSNVLNIKFDAPKCIKCSKDPLNANPDIKEENIGYMLSDMNGGYKCNSEICNFHLTKEILTEGIDMISDHINKLCYKCYVGVYKKNFNTNMYVCSNAKCRHTLKGDLYENRVKLWLDNHLFPYVQTSINHESPIHKSKKRTANKLGSRTEYFNATKLYLKTVSDSFFNVRAAKAINSEIKGTSLKEIINTAPLKEDFDRVYIKGSKILEFYTQNKWFIASNNNLYKEIPKEYQNDPEKYLSIVNDKDKLLLLRDYNLTFEGTVKEIDHDICVDTDAIKKNIGKIFCNKYYEKYCGQFKLIRGSELTKLYALGDVKDTMKVHLQYAAEKFSSVKIHPVPYSRFVTMGTAGAVNALIINMCYHNNLAIPSMINNKLNVGGLSRCFFKGLLKNIKKIDYSSLYPTLQLTFDIFPVFMPYLKEILHYLFNERFYWKHRAKMDNVILDLKSYVIYLKEKGKFDILEEFKNSDNQKRSKMLNDYNKNIIRKYLNYIKEDDENYYNEIISKYKITDYEKYKKLISDYRHFADLSQLTVKIRINSFFGWISSSFGYGADDVLGSFITSSGRMFLRSAAWFFMKYKCVPAVTDTDGINISTPDMIDIDIYGNKLDKEIPFDSLTYKGLFGFDALIKYYNDHYLPIGSEMALGNDGVYASSYQASRKNYINLDPKGKLKLTGNTFKNSNLPNYIVEFMKVNLPILLKKNDIKTFVYNIIQYRKDIIDGKIPVRDIVKKVTINNTVDEYVNRGNTKNGNEKAKQVWMELIIKNNLKVNKGDIIYYINNGNKRNHGDSSQYKDIKYVKLNTYRCNSCGKIHSMEDGKYPIRCENDIDMEKTIKIVNVVIRNLKEKYNEYLTLQSDEDNLNNKQVKKMDTLLKGINKDIFSLKDKITKNDFLHIKFEFVKSIGEIYSYNVESIKDIFIKYDQLLKLGSYVCKSNSFSKVYKMKCTNPECGKVHLKTTVNGSLICDNVIAGLLCENDEFEEEKTQVTEMKDVSYLVSQNEFETKGNELYPYNVEAYDELFLKKLEPIKYIFNKEIRSEILQKNPYQINMEKFEGLDWFGEKEPLDSLDEFFVMEKKEVDAWNKINQQVSINPLAIFPDVIIPKEYKIERWDNYNKIFDTIKDKYVNLKRDKRFANIGDHYMDEQMNIYRLDENRNDIFVTTIK